MSKTSDISLKSIDIEIQQFQYRTPMKFGGRVVESVDLLNVQIAAEDKKGSSAVGFGSMPLGNTWGWPSQICDSVQTLAAMRALAHEIQEDLGGLDHTGHPLEIGHEFLAELATSADRVRQKLEIPESIPKLAQLVVFSPFDAAIHDAYGRILGRNSYQCLGSEFANQDLGHYLSSEFQGEYLDQYVRQNVSPQMPLYHLVGALDPLTDSEIQTRLDDGLPETLGEWIKADGLTHLKIKLNGEDVDWDVQRVLSIDQVTAETQNGLGVQDWFYSTDFNEKCENVEYVLEFLKRIESKSKACYDRIQYIEQPTHRDLKSHPDNLMHQAAKLKPVVIDESLVDFESLLIARDQGYSGVALKACKGQSEALLMGAAAQKFNMFLCVQDLTCVGRSFLHSASLAAWVPTVSAIEGNGRQYCPIGNQPLSKEYPGMFEIHDGSVRTCELQGIGLGF